MVEESPTAVATGMVVEESDGPHLRLKGGSELEIRDGLRVELTPPSKAVRENLGFNECNRGKLHRSGVNGTAGPLVEFEEPIGLYHHISLANLTGFGFTILE